MRAPRLEWTPDAGPSRGRVLLVHGYTDDADTWWHTGPQLAKRGWHVLACDLLGHGLAPRVDAYSLDVLQDDLIALVAAAQPNVVIGHSLGAALLNLTGVDGPVQLLIDPPWGRLPQGLEHYRAQPDRGAIAQREPHWSATDIDMDHRSNLRLDPAVTEWIAGLPLGARHVPEPSLSPTVIVAGERSPMVPRDLAGAAPAWGMEVVWLPDAGHVIHRDCPDEFVELCDSLSARLLAAGHPTPGLLAPSPA